MPKTGQEPGRRKSLVEAAIHMIGEQGSLDVSVKRIAQRAGMSSGLAFHYFGDKEQIIVEAMRHLLRDLAVDLSRRLGMAKSPVQRLNAIFEASLGTNQFDRNTVSAWLVFYCHAQRSPQSARLHAIYSARLKSNLMGALLQLQVRDEAETTARMLAALIDGLYIQMALNGGKSDHSDAIELCHQLVLSRLGNGETTIREQ